MEVKAAAIKLNIAVQVAPVADRCPGRISAQGNNAQKHIHDPDAEVFLAGSGEHGAAGG